MDAFSKLLRVISYEDAGDMNIAYVDDDLTDGERAVIEAAYKEHIAYPESSVSLEELKKRSGITDENLAKLPPLKIVYELK